MKGNGIQKWLQAICCLMCAIVAWENGRPVAGTEFIGGTVTGPIFTLNDVGAFLLLVALLLTFALPRVAATIALPASLLCLPLGLYFVAPGPFRSLFRGEYSVPLQADFVWDKLAFTGFLVTAVLIYLCFRSFFNRPLAAAA